MNSKDFEVLAAQFSATNFWRTQLACNRLHILGIDAPACTRRGPHTMLYLHWPPQAECAQPC